MKNNKLYKCTLIVKFEDSRDLTEDELRVISAKEIALKYLTAKQLLDLLHNIYPFD